MSKRLLSLVLAATFVVFCFIACEGEKVQQAAPAQQPKANPQIEKIQAEINANDQTIAAIETRLQILEEDFTQNLAKVTNEVANYKKRNQKLKSMIGSVSAIDEVPAAAPAPAVEKEGGLPDWFEYFIIIVIILAVLLLGYYVMRPKDVEDEDFDDFDDLDDFDEVEGDGGSGDDSASDDSKSS